MNLFAETEQRALERVMPLAARMRPATFDDVVGQQHAVGAGSLLRRLWESQRIGSIILFGPPGCGKTTIARLLATHSQSQFRQLNAISTGVKEIREILDEARDRVMSGMDRILLFIDELHRLNRGQQEVMLRDIEEGTLAFAGATTANPFFAVSSALISRSQVVELKPLATDDVLTVLHRAIGDCKHGLGNDQVTVDTGALESIAALCDGDVRRALQLLEWSAELADGHPRQVTASTVQLAAQRKAGSYDRDGDTHYDLASALIKSIRGSDADAGIYWLARMLEAGEDVRFLCRRLVILASEDIGNADPQALLVATSAMQACEFVGLPECQFALAQAVIYLACAPKSNAATMAIAAARSDVRQNAILPVPVALRDAHSSSGRDRGHGQGYQYSHHDPDGIVTQDYLGVEREYYHPVPRGHERELIQRLQEIRQRLRNT